ncbi:MAG: hypothetical protein ACREOI_16865 [bacterium]
MQKKQKLSPRNAEDTEIRREELYSATLGDFGEIRRIIFPCHVRKILFSSRSA